MEESLENTPPTDHSEDQHADASSDDFSDEDLSTLSPAIADEILSFEQTFRGLASQYRILDRIGEGTFSTVYKAQDLLYDEFKNDWDMQQNPSKTKVETNRYSKKPLAKFVAIKKIYVSSSPLRIQNELELLHDLRGCKAVCPLITATRYQDQVIAVLPFYEHHDFRDFFRKMRPEDMQRYLRSLFTGLAAVHKAGILHRDIKPTNFLYNIDTEQGVLVDFGLAEREGTEWSHCICTDGPARRRSKLDSSYAIRHPTVLGYPKNDTRPSRRANRAGTRGFRAPEVLFKCTSQTTKIDIWSAGVVLLTMMSQRFPFFNSADDVDAIIEIASIYGKRRTSHCALLHGAMFDCNIPTIGDRGFPFEKLIIWSTSRSDNPDFTFTRGEKMAIRFLERCMELDPKKRISAEEALDHEFLREDNEWDRQDELAYSAIDVRA